MENKDLERVVMFLALPKERQEEIIAEVKKVANLSCEFLKEAAELISTNQKKVGLDTSKEKLDKLLKTQGNLCSSYNSKEIDILSKIFASQYDNVLQDLEALEIIKRSKIIDLVFSDDPYCNLLLSDADNLIDIDYDEKAPTIEMTTSDYETFVKWLKKNK